MKNLYRVRLVVDRCDEEILSEQVYVSEDYFTEDKILEVCDRFLLDTLKGNDGVR